ncbi:radical SAM protein [Dokdonia pacifica]|uniref:4Fe-4S single cluster domain-containing protein n=1 Tax=Dokdonia pacifica TaxID=1627892 RepID=A0A238YEP8_9FLAO|nr:radical SAM protein [Dokdonia pacifica]SNR69756.1 4Fe-4S single cluster domain-containing protein [Dokdonia pacifica]
MFSRTLDELVVHLTKFCPLECDHCNVSASKLLKEDIEFNKLMSIIKDAKELNFKTISFAGGEPFARKKLLISAIEYSNSLNLKTKVVTSAFWGINPDHAINYLSKFKNVGLQEIIFSYDDPHAAYLKENIVINAVNAALHLGIKVTIQVAVEPDSVIDKEYVQKLLDENCKNSDLVVISQALINSTGRALDSSDIDRRLSRRKDHRAFKGPCSSVIKQTTVHTDGSIVPCCGVVPNLETMQKGTYGKKSLSKIIEDSRNDNLYRWIALQGPVSLLCQITKDNESPLTENDFDGICDACNTLFTSPSLLKKARDMSEIMSSTFELQEKIYNAMNWSH